MATTSKLASSNITLPLYYRARSYQMPVWQAFQRGIKRHVAVWHRRAGKDSTYLNITACAMMKRIGNYLHIFPTLKQGREVLWDGIDHAGRRHIDAAFPEALIYEKNESELSVTLRDPRAPTKPGSRWQIVGTDRNLNAVVGGNAVGMVFSEYSLQHPQAWVLAQPILRENGGWAAFCYTPRGSNHGQTLYQIAQAHPDEWFSSLLTIDDTKRDAEGETGGPVVKREEVQADIDSGLIEDAFAQQEYWVSFEAPLQGAYYAQQFKKVDAEGRVGVVPWTPNKPVYTAWDLGVDDSTAIWFLQPVGDRINIIDYYEFWGHGIEHYVKVLRDKPYLYAEHYAPHDIEVREWGTRNPGTTEARSRKDVAADLGLHFVTVGKWDVADGIQAVRLLFPRFWFDKEGCGTGLIALREYQRLWDDKRKIFLDEPYHNWCFTGDTKILTRYGMYQIMDLPLTGEVYTSCGWKAYQNPRITRSNAPLVEVVFDDGYTLRCTPDHLFKTGNGWKSAAHLQTGTVILSSLTPLRSILMAAYIACGRKKRTTRVGARSCLVQYGRELLALSQEAATFITRITILPTIGLATSNAKTLLSTWPSHGTNTTGEQPRSNIFRSLRDSKRLYGIAQKLGGCGIVGMLHAPSRGQNGIGKRSHVSTVGQLLMRWCGLMGIRRSIAAIAAKPLTIASVKPLSETADVWCLTVPNAEEFSLSNGALVHNCSHAADAVRTFAVGWHDKQTLGAPQPGPLRAKGAPFAEQMAADQARAASGVRAQGALRR